MDRIQNAVTVKKTDAVASAEKKSVNQLMNAMLDGEGMRKRFNDLLGERTPQFISSIVSLVNSDSNMLRAFYEAPMTIIQSALKAATFDLPIDQNLGYAYLVPFSNYNKDTGDKKMSCTFILGWKGMNQMALRTGAYKTINVVDVREGELVKYDRLTEEIELHFVEDEEERERLPIVGYVGYYKLVNGATKTIYRTVKQIEAHEQKFRKGQYQSKGWRDDKDAMSRKTIFRELIGKWGVMSIDYKTTPNAELANAMRDQLEEEDNIPNFVEETTGEVIEETKE